MNINNKEFPYSFSQNRLYEDCPRKYKFRYYDGIQEPTNSNLELGTAIHKVFELRAITNCIHPNDWPKEYKDAVDYIKANMPSIYLDKLLIEIDNFMHDKTIIGREEAIQEPNFIAKLDLIYKSEFNSECIVIGDYKVTKKPKTQESIFTEGQLLVYKSKFCNIHPDIDPDKVYVQYINIAPFLSRKLISVTTPYNPRISTCKSVENAMLKNIDKINNKEFPKKTKYCNWCFYKNICDKEPD
jgi:hypothetical protein